MKQAKIHTDETYNGIHYTVTLIDENGAHVATQTATKLSEAKVIKENWVSGKYRMLTETGS